MGDKRFWGGAILVVTVVIAGSSALPALLLRPTTIDPAVAVQPSVRQNVEPAQTEPKFAAAGELPTRPPGTAPLPPPAVETPPPQVAAAPPPRAVSAPPVQPALAEPAAPLPEAKLTFPPVQPVGLVSAGDATPPTRVRNGRVTGSGPEKTLRSVRPARVTSKPKRRARPAVFPIREFLAWRR